MTEIEKTIKVYVANDGKEFFTSYECSEYEKERSLNDERLAFLSVELTKLINEMNIPAWKGASLYQLKVVANKGSCTIYQRYNEDSYWEEPDEDFMYDVDTFWEFKRIAKVRYGYDVNTPGYYWGK